MRAVAVAAVAVVSALLHPAPATPAGTDEVDVCSGDEEPARSGSIQEERVLELSGLAASRRHAGVLWAHNDSGGEPELYAMREDGTPLGAYPVAGAEATDWEDMASGPGRDGIGDHLYIGDIGDNGAERSSVVVYRVPEPDTALARPGATLPGAQAIELTYPDGPSDAEALLVDPRTGDLVIVTKSLSGSSRVLEASAADLATGPVAMADRGALSVPLPPDPGPGLPGTMVTAGDVSPDGSLVLLRTYRSVLLFERGEDQSLAQALQGEPCFAPQAEEDQGEAAAFTGDGAAYVTASEGRGVTVHRVDVPSAPAATTTATAPPSTDPPSRPLTAEDDGLSATATPISVVAGVLLVAVLVAAFSRRRGTASAR